MTLGILLLAVLLPPNRSPHWQRVRPFVRAAFVRMQLAARRDGLTLNAGSSWRSRAEQAYLWRHKPRRAARPGHSMHELGLAIDVTDGRGRCVRRHTRLDRWLSGHVRRYHFCRPLRYEPWHIQWAGPTPPLVPMRHKKGHLR